MRCTDRAITAELLGSADAVDTIGGDPTVVVRVMNEAAQLAQPHAVAEVRFEG